jgi:hypothetical protein
VDVLEQVVLQELLSLKMGAIGQLSPPHATGVILSR